VNHRLDPSAGKFVFFDQPCAFLAPGIFLTAQTAIFLFQLMAAVDQLIYLVFECPELFCAH
jgi:hypothetical protein